MIRPESEFRPKDVRQRKNETYYASPPQKPSMLMRKKTKEKLSPSESSLKNPTADSIARIVRMRACMTAGRPRSRVGSGGIPREIEERERNTVL